ncbi:MAG: acetyl-CoA hydrolase/transferase family protein [Firmicutes bacterium]|nr:acetyl-CoA hydrolase/transferase family protein [Bacillota bacterium]
MTSDLSDRIKCRRLLGKVVTAQEAADLVRDGMTIGASGFTPAGYPKAVPLALAERVKRTGEKLKVNLLTGASVGPELDGSLVTAGVVRKRMPYQTTNAMRDAINKGDVLYLDEHLSHVAQRCRYGFYGPLDMAIIEAVKITEDGHIIPSTSVGNSPTFVKQAKQVIVEINTSQPLDLAGMHDIYIPDDPPARKPIPITSPEQRIGTEYIPCGPDKIAAIVVTDIKDNVRPLAPIDDVARAIAGHLVEFFEHEVEIGRLPPRLLPLQSGVGSVANAVLAGLLDSKFTGMTFYSEVIQDSALDLLDAGKFTIASGTSLTPSPERLPLMYSKMNQYRKQIILRPQEISNNPEVVRRLGSIAMNTAIECDIYGNVNSTSILGTRMMNGIGGSGDFSRNAYLTIFSTESVAKNGAISSIVPMCSHVDHTEHEVHVVVTEQGLADLRGLSPKEKARVIIDNCAHPEYRALLREYLDAAVKAGGHTPHILKEALSWHVKFIESGDMRKR